jgi:hypothetical protein
MKITRYRESTRRRTVKVIAEESDATTGASWSFGNGIECFRVSTRGGTENYSVQLTVKEMESLVRFYTEYASRRTKESA